MGPSHCLPHCLPAREGKKKGQVILNTSLCCPPWPCCKCSCNLALRVTAWAAATLLHRTSQEESSSSPSWLSLPVGWSGCLLQHVVPACQLPACQQLAGLPEPLPVVPYLCLVASIWAWQRRQPVLMKGQFWALTARYHCVRWPADHLQGGEREGLRHPYRLHSIQSAIKPGPDVRLGSSWPRMAKLSLARLSSTSHL